MSFFDDLRQGNSYYNVTPTSTGGFGISSSSEASAERQRFVQLAEEAIRRAHSEGYGVTRRHESSRDPYGLDQVIFEPHQ
ncbi:hypothetical protein [Bradyrhizobium brasilense]|uniref:hypothetical protein n=1 Tax=Bradyrhizobium brasilense TaxID=1419277 RepID=UPI000B885015|nr:hypothetical protein [Bradyrhizobium brasilense]